MQTLFVNGQEIKVVRGFSQGPNGAFILERPDGSFTYVDGKPVKTRDELEFLPVEHRERAYEWFDRASNPEVYQQAAEQAEAATEELSIKQMKQNLKDWGVKLPFGIKNADVPAFYQETLKNGYTRLS